MSNGLDSLDAQRRRGRPILPPAHRPRSTPVQLPEPPATAEAIGEHREEPVAPKQTTPKGGAAEAAEVVARRTIHLSPTEDDFLDSVFMAGRQDPAGKFDASRSAVVRLALARLADEMSPDQVVSALKKRVPRTAPTGGRPRR